jgi:hypothetical protein
MLNQTFRLFFSYKPYNTDVAARRLHSALFGFWLFVSRGRRARRRRCFYLHFTRFLIEYFYKYIFYIYINGSFAYIKKKIKCFIHEQDFCFP